MKIVVGNPILITENDITGSIWINVSKTSYPCEGWPDLVIACLRWWMELWSIGKRNNFARMRFLDGRYYFEIETVGTRTFLTLFEEGDAEVILERHEITIAEWETELVNAAKSAISMVEGYPMLRGSDRVREIEDRLEAYEQFGF